MKSSAEVTLRTANEQDMGAVSRFMQSQGQTRCSEAYLCHWYFRSPNPQGCVVIAEQSGALVGMATMTLHRIVRNDQRCIVGMPQKVLTHESLRGQGVFGKLYRASQRLCTERGADFFLTVTNAASTPIFLQRFGYVRLPVPKLAVLTPRPGRLRTSPLNTLAPCVLDLHPPSWTLHRDGEYLRWRFQAIPGEDYVAVRIGAPGAYLGQLILKRIVRRGLPILLLLHAAPAAPESAAPLLRSARQLAWRERCVALLCLEGSALHAALRANHSFTWSTGFNFLATGGVTVSTEELKSHSFDLTFGDLDFV